MVVFLSPDCNSRGSSMEIVALLHLCDSREGDMAHRGNPKERWRNDYRPEGDLADALF